MALTPDKDSSTMPAELSFQCVNEFVHSIDTQFEELQALCLGLASELEKSKQDEDCLTCANRGVVNGLTQETFCDGCIYQSRSWRRNHFKATI